MSKNTDRENNVQPVRPARPSLLDHLAHAALARALAAAEELGTPPLCVDGTAGNGHDALFLAETAPHGALLLLFDVQPQALAATAARLEAARAQGQRARWRCLPRGHELLGETLRDLPPEEAALPLMAAVFNFGWLPGGDKSRVTRAETSLRAAEAALERMAPRGCLCLHCYTGHPGGAAEEAALRERLERLPPRQWRVFYGRDINRDVPRNSPLPAAREESKGLPGYESLLLAERLPVRRNRETPNRPSRVPTQGSPVAQKTEGGR